MVINLFNYQFQILSKEQLQTVSGGGCGDKIKYYRESLKMTQVELARQLFVSQQTVHKWEHGINEPSLDTIRQLRQIFGQTAGDIID